MKNKIGWCNATWNPVIGCKNNCEYCYARNFNTRFRFIKFWNEPEWRENSFEKMFPKKPQRIFVGSMSEIYYWEKRWMEVILGRILCYPQHTFQFLTRYPRAYKDYEFPSNCWVGVTITNNNANYAPKYLGRINFISIEPILEEINVDRIDFYEPDWIIIGAETGNRKGKVIPKKEWIENIVNYCKEASIPVYLKDSLKNIYPVEIKEFPEVRRLK